MRNIRLLYIHNFLTDFRVQEAFLVIYFAQVSGSYASAMAVLSIATLTGALMDIPTGVLSDKYGRRFTLMLGSICCTLGLVCYAMAHGVTLLFFGGFLCGLSKCMFSGNNNALLYESLKEHDRSGEYHHYLGRTSSMFQVALAISAYVSIAFSHSSLRTLFIIAPVPQFLAFLVSLFFHEPKVTHQKNDKNFTHFIESLRVMRGNPRLMLLVTGQAISRSSVEASFQFQNVFLKSFLPIWQLSFFRALNHTLSSVTFWFAGRLIDRFKELMIITCREVYWFVSQLFAIACANPLSPYVFVSGTVFFGPGMVAEDHLMQKEFTPQQRATLSSISSVFTSMLYAGLSLCVGIISDAYGTTAGLTFSVCCGILSLPFFIRALNRKREVGT